MQKNKMNSLLKVSGAVCAVLAVIITVALTSRPKDTSYNPLDKGLSLYAQQKYEQAELFFAQADVMNSPEAAFILGAMSFTGKVRAPDVPKALAYYEKAADAGYAPAQMTLAVLYADGEHVEKDTDKAVDYARKAAENKDKDALMMLARWYENGENVTKNMRTAVKYYKEAALQGNMNAKIALMTIYKNGAGEIAANPYLAQQWSDSIKKQKKYENIFDNRPADFIEQIRP